MADSGVHEVLRYARGEEIRIYSFHVVPGGTELWRVTHRRGAPDEAVMESSFTRPVEAAQFLEEVTRALIAGGWRPIEGR